jgi:hypothetical protein
MNRKTLLTLGVFAVIAILAIVVQRQPEKGERTGAGQRPIPVINAGDVDTLDVTKDGKTATIKKEGDKYTVTAPVNYPADANAAKEAFDGLSKVSFGSIVTDQPGKQGEFEIDDAKAIHVVAKKGPTMVADFLLGKQLGNGAAFRLPGKNEIWQASNLPRWAFDRDVASWREKSITTFNATDVETLTIKNKAAGSISLKKDGEGKWSVVSSSTPIDTLDGTTADGVISTMTGWKAADFADGAKLAEVGLENPHNTVVIGLKGGKTLTALLGNKKSDGKGDEDTYVKLADGPQVFTVKKWGVERVDRRPVDFKDKTLCNLGEGELGEISVSNGKEGYTLARGTGKDDAWQATKPPKFTLDTSKASNIAGAFKDWKATGVAEDLSLAANGLDKPRAEIKAVSKDKKKTCSLKIGNENKDKTSVVAQVAGKSEPLLVPKWTVDRVLVKLDELKKK